MSRPLQHMRGTLSEWDTLSSNGVDRDAVLFDTEGSGLARTAVLLDAPAEVLGKILEHTPAANDMVTATSSAIRRQLATLQPLAPAVFHVFLDQFPLDTQSRRREIMLAALETQSEQFRLRSIEIPDFVLDEEIEPRPHPPQLAHERGAVWLTVVLWRRCAALESLDLGRTRIENWSEIGRALPSCVALQRLDLSGANFYPRNNPFAGLAQCRTFTELRLQDCDLTQGGEQLVHHRRDVHHRRAESPPEPAVPRPVGLIPGNQLHAAPRGGAADVPASRAPGALARLAGSQALRGLASLDVSRCRFDYRRGAPYGAPFLVELEHCPRLEAMNLSENDLGDTFVRALTGRLPASLTRLDLCDTAVSDAGVRALALPVSR